jgi:hypothetical protein
LRLVPHEFHCQLFGDVLTHAAKLWLFYVCAISLAKDIKNVFGLAVVDECDILKVPGSRNSDEFNVLIYDVLLNDEQFTVDIRVKFFGFLS